MIYSNKQIKEAVDEGHIIVHPFNPKNIAGSSLDVCLGEWYFTPGADTSEDTYNPNSGKSVKTFFGEPKKAMKHSEWCKENKKPAFKGIPADQQIIVIPPGERFICHTEEFVGILPPGTTKMHARSSWARNGLMVRLDAGWGDPGFIGRWGMPMLNTNKKHSLVIPVGERVAQIIFLETGEVNGDYSTISGQYQKKNSKIEQLVKNWKPSDLLPKSYRENRDDQPDILAIKDVATDAAALSDVLKEKAHSVQSQSHTASELAFMHSDVLQSQSHNYLLKDERGNYLYYTPKTLDAKSAKLFEETTNQLFKNYAKAFSQLETYFKDSNTKSVDIDQIHELISDLLPVSAYVKSSSQIHEIDQIGTDHVLSELINTLAPRTISDTSETVNVLSATPKNELELAQSLLFSQTDIDPRDINSASNDWSYADKTKLIKKTLEGNQKSAILKNAHYFLQLVLPMSKLRNIKKNCSSITLQELSPRNGYSISKHIEKAELADLFEETYEMSFKLHSAMQAKGYYTEAQYACLNGTLQRALVQINAHQIQSIKDKKVRNVITESLREVHPLIHIGDK